MALDTRGIPRKGLIAVAVRACGVNMILVEGEAGQLVVKSFSEIVVAQFASRLEFPGCALVLVTLLAREVAVETIEDQAAFDLGVPRFVRRRRQGMARGAFLVRIPSLVSVHALPVNGPAEVGRFQVVARAVRGMTLVAPAHGLAFRRLVVALAAAAPHLGHFRVDLVRELDAPVVARAFAHRDPLGALGCGVRAARLDAGAGRQPGAAVRRPIFRIARLA